MPIRDVEREKGLCALLLHVVSIDIAIASTGDEDKGGIEDEKDVLSEEGRKSCAADFVGVVASN